MQRNFKNQNRKNNNIKFTWKIINNIWTKILIERKKEQIQQPRVKPPRNKEKQTADEGEPSMPEQKNKN